MRKLVFCLLAAGLLNGCGDGGAASKKDEQKNQPPAAAVRNSGYDASVYQVERFLKEKLKDPDSYKGVEWSHVIENGDHFMVRHKYRAKNSFGGYVVEEYLFALDKKGRVVGVADKSDDKAVAIFYLTYGQKKGSDQSPSSNAPAIAKLIAPSGRIDAAVLAKGAPLTDRKQGQYSDGKRKQTHWTIKGFDPALGYFKVIGSTPSDADFATGYCMEDAGKNVKPWSKDSKCYAVFRAVLANVVDKPEVVADHLLRNSPGFPNGQNSRASVSIGDVEVSLQGSVGGWFTIARKSRKFK